MDLGKSAYSTKITRLSAERGGTSRQGHTLASSFERRLVANPVAISGSSLHWLLRHLSVSVWRCERMTAGCRSWGEHQATEEQVRARQGSSGIDKKGGYSSVRFAGAK